MDMASQLERRSLREGIIHRIVRSAQLLMSRARPERRRVPRLFGVSEILLVTNPENRTSTLSAANLLNRSRGGLCVLHRESLILGQRVIVVTPELSQPARVVWCKPTAAGHEIGLAYTTQLRRDGQL